MATNTNGVGRVFYPPPQAPPPSAPSLPPMPDSGGFAAAPGGVGRVFYPPTPEEAQAAEAQATSAALTLTLTLTLTLALTRCAGAVRAPTSGALRVRCAQRDVRPLARRGAALRAADRHGAS